MEDKTLSPRTTFLDEVMEDPLYHAEKFRAIGEEDSPSLLQQ